MSAVTAITIQDEHHIQRIQPLPAELILGQTRSVLQAQVPAAIKIGLLPDAETIHALRDEIGGYPNIVCAPGIISSHGHSLLDEKGLHALRHSLLPQTRVLTIRCDAAEILLGMAIRTQDDMLTAAKTFTELGTEAVLLRGGHTVEGRLTALLYTADEHRFFSSPNMKGWQRHGVGGALSTAITVYLALGDDVFSAVSHAHTYVHSQIVYAVSSPEKPCRATDLYNQLMTLLSAHYQEAHDVAFYADRLCITTRYLGQITEKILGKSPKQIIADYLLQEALTLLGNSRMTIQEISHYLGFSSQASFCNFFRKQTGKTPSNHRLDL